MRKNHRIKRHFSRKLQILYEDSWVIAVNKPAGLLTQSDITNDPDLLTLTKRHLALKKTSNEPFTGLVHRLDRPVSGAVVFALTKDAAAILSKQFAQNVIIKLYHAVVHGRPPQEGTWIDHLMKESTSNISKIAMNDPSAKYSKLKYKKLAERGDRSLVEIELQTGRSHQIRIQFSSRGFPIVGDRKYGSREVLFDPGMIALWARFLTFAHPQTGKLIELESPKPLHWPWHEIKRR